MTEVEGLTDLPIIMVNTHADSDHIFGNEILRYRFDYAGFLCELKE